LAKKKVYHFVDPYLVNPNHPITVNLIGCGGTGSQFLSALAKIHVSLRAIGHAGLMVYAWDGDKVEESNIGRQAFAMADIGTNKAIVAITRINRYFGLDWIAVPEMITEKTEPDRLLQNITVTCVDTGSARVLIGSKIKGKLRAYRPHRGNNKGLYWLDFGNSKTSGQVILGSWQEIKQPTGRKYRKVKKLKTILDLHPDLADYDNDKEQGPSCSTLEALNKQDLFINSTIVQFGGDLLWKMFREYRLQFHGAYINLANFNINPIPV